MQEELKTMGDLRKFLAGAMQDVRDGKLDQAKAGQVAKLAAQINASIHAEIAARAHMEIKGEGFNGLDIFGKVPEKKLIESSVAKPATVSKNPYTELTQEQYDLAVKLKKDGKKLPSIIELTCADSPPKKKAVTEIFYGRPA